MKTLFSIIKVDFKNYDDKKGNGSRMIQYRHFKS